MFQSALADAPPPKCFSPHTSRRQSRFSPPSRMHHLPSVANSSNPNKELLFQSALADAPPPKAQGRAADVKRKEVSVRPRGCTTSQVRSLGLSPLHSLVFQSALADAPPPKQLARCRDR